MGIVVEDEGGIGLADTFDRFVWGEVFQLDGLLGRLMGDGYGGVGILDLKPDVGSL